MKRQTTRVVSIRLRRVRPGGRRCLRSIELQCPPDTTDAEALRLILALMEQPTAPAASLGLVRVGSVAYHVWRSPLIEVFNGQLVPALINHNCRSIAISAAVPDARVAEVVERVVAKAAAESPWDDGGEVA